MLYLIYRVERRGDSIKYKGILKPIKRANSPPIIVVSIIDW